ncbi:MAG: hypothetical protein K2G04_06325, partial [Oscillospiraceae bacterium]|nr:hypothetical protein [Oscillospiraceae bacterium]
MKESKRRQSLSGAVLIMILTVMFVLIILLTATLTTVTTANQRIYTKFEENQAYYTARSALDVFTQNMLADKSHIEYKYTVSSGASGAAVPYVHGDNVTTDLMKQGLGLQLDLYSITAQSGHNVKQADFISYATDVRNDASIPAADKKDEYLHYFGVEPTAGTPINNIYYEVEFPAVTDTASNKYGKLSDNGTAKIKVEVLDRRYDMGAYNFSAGAHSGTDIKTYLDTLNDDDLKDFFENMTSDEAKDVAKAVAMGSRKKDTMSIKITATSIFDGVEGTAVLIIDSNEPPVNNSSRAITAFGGTGSDNM